MNYSGQLIRLYMDPPNNQSIIHCCQITLRTTKGSPEEDQSGELATLDLIPHVDRVILCYMKDTVSVCDIAIIALDLPHRVPYPAVKGIQVSIHPRNED